MFQRIIVRMAVAKDAQTGAGVEPVLVAGEFSEGGRGSVLAGYALNEHAFVGRAVLPPRHGVDVAEQDVVQPLNRDCWDLPTLGLVELLALGTESSKKQLESYEFIVPPPP